jgi:tripartite-type tricarboxylate transporter receptor subunit TctC
MKKTLALAALACAAFISQAPAHAQAAYPAKPIRLIIGFAPGGAADTLARAMSEGFSKALGQTVVVENKPGNGSSIAADFVAKAPPDGYTMLIASPSSIFVNPAMNSRLSYSASDLTPVTKMTSAPLVLAVNPASGIKSLQDLIAAAKAAPGKLNYASSGNGSAPHLGAVLFEQLTGAKMTHIPYKGGSLAIQSVMARDTDLVFGTSTTVLAVAGEKLKPLAVSTRAGSELVPGVPGMSESGLPGFNLDFWYGMFVPAGTPAPIVKKIYDATAAAMRQPAIKTVLARDGTEVSLSSSQADFEKFMAEDKKFWVKLVKDADLKM